MNSNWSHEESYKGGGAVALAHRNRLKHIVHLFEDLVIESRGALADFGCSNGYVISVLQQEVFRNKDWRFVGFDHTEHLLSQARAKQLTSTEFRFLELNAVSTDTSDRFDIVTCFETLEHTGDYRNAFNNLYQACRVGGYILISVPNERGFPGIIKYFGRKVLRKNAYGNFFNGKSEGEYVKALILSRPIETFRIPEAEGWGPHLGFDFKCLEEFITETFIGEGKLQIEYQGGSALNFTRLYIFRKMA